LPKGAAKEIQAAARDFTVAILKDGSVGIDGKVVDEQLLRSRFEQLHRESPEAQVIIQADTGVQHGKVVEVMEAAKGVGIDRLAIATDAGGK
jgi:biopolymer transport protein ExbD